MKIVKNMLRNMLKNMLKNLKIDENYKNLLVNIAVSIVFTLKINSCLEIIELRQIMQVYLDLNNSLRFHQEYRHQPVASLH